MGREASRKHKNKQAKNILKSKVHEGGAPLARHPRLARDSNNLFNCSSMYLSCHACLDNNLV